ncbi:alpha/beta hydrolase [Skermanella pratensis]|uniref:alpha/beta hydrolase n=1 Tax=Skermanella pratensis TaxID=2233999 RepID=UPI001B3B8D9F|nr:alpha/beta fold hydrolase [Skermanella pratensis]
MRDDPAGMPIRDRRVSVGGVELQVATAGPADGPPVILLHGFPESRLAWHRQIGPLAAAGLRLVVPDQRGYGRSGKPGRVGDYAVDTLAGDVIGLADSLGIGRFAVVGHDWGAVLAWHLAERYPDRVERAAVLNGPHLATVRRHVLSHPSQGLRSWYVGFFQVPWLPEKLLGAQGFAGMRRLMEKTARPGTFAPEDWARYRDAWEQPGAPTAMLNWYRALRHRSRSPSPRSIGIPMRVIWGDRDAALDPRLAEAGASLCSRCEVFHIPEASHWVQHEEPERVNRLLIGFLVRPPA